MQGYYSGGIPLLVVGVGKGAIGALGRPAVGLLECSSKTAHAVNILSPRCMEQLLKWHGQSFLFWVSISVALPSFALLRSIDEVGGLAVTLLAIGH